MRLPRRNPEVIAVFIAGFYNGDTFGKKARHEDFSHSVARSTFSHIRPTRWAFFFTSSRDALPIFFLLNMCIHAGRYCANVGQMRRERCTLKRIRRRNNVIRIQWSRHNQSKSRLKCDFVRKTFFTRELL